jgi:hypothetical protein
LLAYISVGLEVYQAAFINFHVLGKSHTLNEENVYEKSDESSHDEGQKQMKVQHIAGTAQLSAKEKAIQFAGCRKDHPIPD